MATPQVVVAHPGDSTKTNLPQIIQFFAGIFASFGIIITPDQQLIILQVLVVGTPIATWLLSRWLVPSAPTKEQLVAALKESGYEVKVKRDPKYDLGYGDFN